MNITKYTIVLVGAAAVFVSGAAFAQTFDDQPAAVVKKPEKITDKRHPDYVRCRSEPVIGSRVKKRRVCLTNREWKAFSSEGNQRAKDLVTDHQSGLSGS